MKLWKLIKPFFVLVIVCSMGCATPQQPVTPEQQTRSPDESLAGLQAGLLGPGDEIQVIVWRRDDLNRTLRIGPSGQIFFPLVGVIQAGGLSPNQLREIITQGLAEHFLNPQVNVEVASYKSRNFYVLGEVRKPGMFVIETSVSAIEAIALAGGFTLDANLGNVILLRQEPGHVELRSLNLKALLREGDLQQNAAICNKDVLYVIPTMMTDISRFMAKFYTTIMPLVEVERGIIYGYEVSDLIEGKSSSRVVIPVN